MKQPNAIKIGTQTFYAYSFSYLQCKKLHDWFGRLIKWHEQKNETR